MTKLPKIEIGGLDRAKTARNERIRYNSLGRLYTRKEFKRKDEATLLQRR